MKPILIILLTSGSLVFGWKTKNTNLTTPGITNEHLLEKNDGDSSYSIHIINSSSLKRLPDIIRDLSAALKKSIFLSQYLLNKNGIAIYLYDVTCNSFENSAAVKYRVNDTVYHVKLNNHNKQATDKALAATLIHELMHCVLLDIYNDARHGNERALAIIKNFRLESGGAEKIDYFFAMVNSGDAGQHELIYQIFYSQMVSLLETFAAIHRDTFQNREEAEELMWSGLQQTAAYKRLAEEEREEIESVIMKAKRVNVNLENY